MSIPRNPSYSKHDVKVRVQSVDSRPEMSVPIVAFAWNIGAEEDGTDARAVCEETISIGIIQMERSKNRTSYPQSQRDHSQLVWDANSITLQIQHEMEDKNIEWCSTKAEEMLASEAHPIP